MVPPVENAKIEEQYPGNYCYENRKKYQFTVIHQVSEGLDKQK